MVNFLHHIGVLCLFIATVLLIIVSVSTPVWTKINFLYGTILNQRLIMGNWGLCIGNVCTNSRLGYDLSFLTNSRLLGSDGRLAASIVNGLTYALILNPIAAGFTFVALLLSLSTYFLLGIAASIASFFAFAVTILAFAIDLAMFIITRDRLNKITEVQTYLGNAMWLILVAVILQLLASILVCCTHHRNRTSRYNDSNAYDTNSYGNNHEMVQKRKWYQKKRGNDGINGNGYSGSTVI